MQKKFLAIRKTFTLAPSERVAGEINNKGEEKTGGYPNGGEISLSRQRSPRELCGAGRRRARRTRERAVAAGRGGGAAQGWVYPHICVATRLGSRHLGQCFCKKIFKKKFTDLKLPRVISTEALISGQCLPHPALCAVTPGALSPALDPTRILTSLW